MDINLEFDPSVASAPAGFTAAVQYAASYFDTLLTDPITVNISVGFDEIGGQPITEPGEAEGGPVGGLDISYSQLQQLLAAHLTSAAQSEMLANLPTTDPTGGNPDIYISPAEEQAWGLLPADDTALDGQIGFDTASFDNFDPNDRNDPNTVDVIGEAEHEIAHALGRISENADDPNFYTLLDLTRYAAPGVLASASTAAPYFSIDGGNTNLDVYDADNGSDPADWAGSTPDSFDAIETGGTEDPVTPVDITLMNVLGFAVASAPPPPTSFTAGTETALDDALTAIGHGPANTTFNVTLTGSIVLTAVLPSIALPSGATLVLNGAGSTVDGGGRQNGLVVAGGAVVPQNLEIKNTVAAGNGGNGAAGGLFVGTGATVSLQGVILAGNTVAGGFGGLPAGGDVFVAPGGVLNMTSGILTGSTVIAGGVVAGSGIFLSGDTSAVFAPGPGQTVDIGDAITDAPGATGMPANAQSGYVIVTGGGLVRFYVPNSYTGVTALGGGATLDLLASGAVSNGVISFIGPATLRIEPGVAVGVPINALVAGCTVDLIGVSDGGSPAAVGFDPASQVLSVAGSVGGTLDLQLESATADYVGNFVASMDAGGTGTDITYVACFAAGTRILTDAGEVPVEQLTVGGLVRTPVRGGMARVRWLGHQRIIRATDCVWPVRIQPGAFGIRAPHHALLLSPDHAVYLDGVLIPVRYLLNGASIARVPVECVEYWHVELDRHAVILADGLACESYLDTGNRSAFDASSTEAGCCFPPQRDGRPLAPGASRHIRRGNCASTIGENVASAIGRNRTAICIRRIEKCRRP